MAPDVTVTKGDPSVARYHAERLTAWRRRARFDPATMKVGA